MPPLGTGTSVFHAAGAATVRAQVRNYELRLRKARVALQEQEVEVAREHGQSILELDRWYELARPWVPNGPWCAPIWRKPLKPESPVKTSGIRFHLVDCWMRRLPAGMLTRVICEASSNTTSHHRTEFPQGHAAAEQFRVSGGRRMESRRL